MTVIKAVAAIAVTTALAAAATGCGNRATTASPSTVRASAADLAQISDVSARYLRALFAGRPNEANSYVVPSSRGIIKALQLSLRKSSGSLDDLRIGQVNVTGARARVVFMGTMCHLKDGKREGCLTNNDPKPTDDNFGLELAKLNSTWQVYIPQPRATYSETEGTYP